MIWGITNKVRNEWRRWYAWYPVHLVNGRTAWLSDVEKLGNRYREIV